MILFPSPFRASILFFKVGFLFLIAAQSSHADDYYFSSTDPPGLNRTDAEFGAPIGWPVEGVNPVFNGPNPGVVKPDAVEFTFPASLDFDPDDRIFFIGPKPIRIIVEGDVTIPDGMVVAATCGGGKPGFFGSGGFGGDGNFGGLGGAGGTGGAGGSPFGSGLLGLFGFFGNPGFVGVEGNDGRAGDPGQPGFANAADSIGSPGDAGLKGSDGAPGQPVIALADGGAGGAVLGDGRIGDDGADGTGAPTAAEGGRGGGGGGGGYYNPTGILVAGSSGGAGGGGGGGAGGGGGPGGNGGGGGGGGGGNGNIIVPLFGTAGGAGGDGGRGGAGGKGGRGREGARGGSGGGAFEIRTTGLLTIGGRLSAGGGNGIAGNGQTVPGNAGANGVDGSAGQEDPYDGFPSRTRGGHGGAGGKGGTGGAGGGGGSGGGGSGGTIILDGGEGVVQLETAELDVGGGAAGGPDAEAGANGLVLVRNPVGLIGIDSFDYASGSIAGRSGGFGFDWDNFNRMTTASDSDWDIVSGSPNNDAVFGQLVTFNGSAKREYNGPGEGVGSNASPTDERLGAFRGKGAVYYKVDLVRGADATWSGLSSYDFGAERIFFGVSFFTNPASGLREFGIEESGVQTAYSGIVPVPGRHYTLVAKLDFDADKLSLWVNPKLNEPESSNAPDATLNYTKTNWSTAVRLGSGGTAIWDNLAVSGSWPALSVTVTSTQDGDDGSLDPASGSGNGITLREAINHAPSGSLINFAPNLSGGRVTLTQGELVIPVASTIDASCLSRGLTIDGNNSSRLISVRNGRSLELRGLTLTGGSGDGADNAGLGGAIANNGGRLRLVNCTLMNNTAAQGGAIWSDTNFTDQVTELQQCTLADNTATATGGAIRNLDGLTTLTSCTLSDNISPDAAGIASYGDTFTLTQVESCIVSGNVGPDLSLVPAVGNNSYSSLGHNLVGFGDGNGAFTQSGDQRNVADPLLGPLGDYGGPAMTMHPGATSPAIDSGTSDDPGGTDQRGFARSVDTAGSGGPVVDIGAVEANPLGLLVTNANDDGLGSLRRAIQTANAPGFDRVTFDPGFFDGEVGDTILLNSGSLVLVGMVEVDARGLAAPVTVSANDSSRVLEIGPDAEVVLRNLNIEDGRAANPIEGPGESGGGIHNQGILTVFDSVVRDCVAGRGGIRVNGVDPLGGNGGGIFNDSGTLTLVATVVSGCRAGVGGSGLEGVDGGDGGGIYNHGTLHLRDDSLITGCQGGQASDGGDDGAGGSGGGIFNASGATATMEGSSVSGNRGGNSSGSFAAGPGGSGGGIYNEGSFTIRANSEVRNNTAGTGATSGSWVGGFGGDGGGIFNGSGGVMTVENTTVSNNVGGAVDEEFSSPPGRAGRGGGIFNSGELTLTASTISGNRSGNPAPGLTDEPGGHGGGVYNDGTVEVQGSSISGNEAGSGATGGGVFNGGTFTANGSMIDGNTAENEGAGVLNNAGGELTLEGSVVSDNLDASFGVGINNRGTLVLKNSSLLRNTGGGEGGGLANSGNAELENVTVCENQAGFGGGTVNFLDGTLQINHSTISGNVASLPSFGAGGGIRNLGSLDLSASVVALNSAAVRPDLDNVGLGVIATIGSNLIGDNSGSGLGQISGLIGTAAMPVDPLLAPLGDFGGPTPAKPPLPGSPVIEGATLLAGTPAQDQLGNPRVSGLLPDLGAVEAIAFVPLGLADSEPDGIPDILEGPGGPYPHLTVGTDDSEVDTDRDGSTDAEEIGDMTDSLDGNDLFQIISVVPDPGFDGLTNRSVLVTVRTFPGLSYQFESDPAHDDFQEIPGASFVADDHTMTLGLTLKAGRDLIRARRDP